MIGSVVASAVGVQIKSSTGALVMDLSFANGWNNLAFDGHGVNWVRNTVASDYVDGEFDATVRRGPSTLSVSMLAFASTLAGADSLVEDLIDAVSAPSWQITRTLSGVSTTWRCRAADVTVSFSTSDWLNHRRVVTLAIPSQPNPTIVGA